MADYPRSVRINEEGPREGFQFEKGAIPTARKIELIDSLSRTGLRKIMAAFGCNLEGDIPNSRILELCRQIFDIAAAHGLAIKVLSLADTMAWATPLSIRLAEDIVGHPLPGAVKNGGTLAKLREKITAV